jgi:hypothetical protein
MPKVPAGGAGTRRAWASMLAAGLVLAACDLNPFVVDRQRSVGPNDGGGRPVETVTALEVDTGIPDQQP